MGSMGPNGPRGATKGPKWEIKRKGGGELRGNPFPLIPYITYGLLTIGH